MWLQCGLWELLHSIKSLVLPTRSALSQFCLTRTPCSQHVRLDVCWASRSGSLLHGHTHVGGWPEERKLGLGRKEKREHCFGAPHKDCGTWLKRGVQCHLLLKPLPALSQNSHLAGESLGYSLGLREACRFVFSLSKGRIMGNSPSSLQVYVFFVLTAFQVLWSHSFWFSA